MHTHVQKPCLILDYEILEKKEFSCIIHTDILEFVAAKFNFSNCSTDKIRIYIDYIIF